MVLFDKEALLAFPRYGIQIPALDSRKTRTMDALRSHDELGKRENEWLLPSVGPRLGRIDLERVHDPAYVADFFDPEMVDERLITSYELVNPDGSRNRWEPEQAEVPLSWIVPGLLTMITGTYRAGDMALDKGFIHFLGGGMHHGHYDFGHGFCPFNDVLVSLARLRFDRRIDHAWVLDLDAHKGDGTAAIAAKLDWVDTLSIHMARGWPLDGSLPMDHPSYWPSDIDIPIESGEEDVYVHRLTDALAAMEKDFPRPDLVYVLAGADPWEGDQLTSTDLLNLNLEQLSQRDRQVYHFLEERNLPSAWVTAGGYGDGAWRIHANFLTWVLERRVLGKVQD